MKCPTLRTEEGQRNVRKYGSRQVDPQRMEYCLDSLVGLAAARRGRKPRPIWIAAHLPATQSAERGARQDCVSTLRYRPASDIVRGVSHTDTGERCAVSDLLTADKWETSRRRVDQRLAVSLPLTRMTQASSRHKEIYSPTTLAFNTVEHDHGIWSFRNGKGVAQLRQQGKRFVQLRSQHDEHKTTICVLVACAIARKDEAHRCSTGCPRNRMESFGRP